jgi:hypothetical protein
MFGFWAWVKWGLEMEEGEMGPNQLKKKGKLADFRRFLKGLE